MAYGKARATSISLDLRGASNAARGHFLLSPGGLQSLLVLASVAARLQSAVAMRCRRALANAKIDSNATLPYFLDAL